MNDKKKLERREFIIEDEIGRIIGDLSLVSFVSSPAHKGDFKTFSSDKYVFSQVNPEKHLVIGPVMRVGVDMLRQDKLGQYFNGFFTEEQVLKCSQIYLKNNNHKKTNVEHGKILTQNEIDGVVMTQSWIVVDPENDAANALGFKEINKGDWYGAFYIENQEFWDFIKANGGGFSIEGLFAERIAQSFSELFEKENELELEERIKAVLFREDFTDLEKEEKIKNILNIGKK
jgi:hypothetical protein